MSSSTLKHLFNQWASSCREDCRHQQWMLSKWDILQGTEWSAHKCEILKQHICRHLSFENDDRLLDLGCGGGWILDAVSESVGVSVGCDIALEMLKHASSDLLAVNADGTRLPFRDNTFDKVLCYFVLINFEHWDDIAAVIKEIIRVLKPGGKALIGQLPDKTCSSQYDEAAAAYRAFCYDQFSITGSNRDTAYIPIALYERSQFCDLLNSLPCRFSIEESFNPYYRDGEPETVSWRFDIVCHKE